MKRITLLLSLLIITLTTVSADNDKPITVEQLPATAKQFIQNYFQGVTVSYAKQETELFDKSYEVVFTNGNKVEFNKKGEWKDVDCKFTHVPEGIIPSKIKAYVTSNYKDASIVEIDRDRNDYEVKLSNGLELSFDLKFNLIKIDN